jgi:hypothetical protein
MSPSRLTGIPPLSLSVSLSRPSIAITRCTRTSIDRSVDHTNRSHRTHHGQETRDPCAFCGRFTKNIAPCNAKPRYMLKFTRILGEDQRISVILYATLNPVSRVHFKPSLIGLGSNPGLSRGVGNTSVKGQSESDRGEQVRHTQTRSKSRRLARILNHDVYTNNDGETTVEEFLVLLLRIMRVPGSNPMPDPATRIATLYLITLQASVAMVLKITAYRHARTHPRLHCSLLILSHNNAFYTYSFFFHNIGLPHQRPSSSNGVVWSTRPTNTVGRLRLRQLATTLER